MSDLETDPALEGSAGLLELCRNLDYWTAVDAIIRVRFPNEPDALFLTGKDFDADEEIDTGDAKEGYVIEGEGGRYLRVYQMKNHSEDPEWVAVYYNEDDEPQGYEAIEVYKGVNTDV